MTKRKSLLAVICAFCLTLAGGMFSLLPKTAQKVEAVTTGAHNVSDIWLHGSANPSSLYLILRGTTTLEHDLASGLTEDTNAYLKDFANQLIFNGEPFETPLTGGKITTQDSPQNWRFSREDGKPFVSGDWLLIPQGTVFKTSTVTFTFTQNYRFQYTGDATTHTTLDGIACSSGGCQNGFHVTKWTGTASSISNISLNQIAGGKNSAYLINWTNVVQNPGFAIDETEDTNGLLKAYANQITLNGERFGNVGTITSRGSENILFQKADGTEFKEGDTIYIPYGTKMVSGSAVWTYAYNFKIVASSKACSEIEGCASTASSQYCRSGFYHVYRWANGATEPDAGVPVGKTYADNTAVMVSAMANTDGTIGKIPYYYATQGYAISFNVLDHYGAGFGLVIGNQTDIDALNNNFNYWLFKQDGTSVNSFGYTGKFSYTIGNTYKFAVENGKINLYEKGVLEAETDYEKVASVNFTASSWNSIGVYAVSDENRSATAIVDNLAIYDQSGTITVFANCDGATPAGWRAQNSNGKGKVVLYNQIMYQVSFLDEKGNLLSTQNVCANGQAVAPAQAPVIDGYEFTGWSDDYSVITSSVTIFPTYKAIGEDEPVLPPEDSSSDSSADSSTDSSVDSSTDSSTDSSSDSVVDSSTDSSTDSSSDSVVDSSTDSSTESSEDSSTNSSTGNTTDEETSSTGTSQGDTQSSQTGSDLKVGGCAGSVAGIIPILTLLGVGLFIKKREER